MMLDILSMIPARVARADDTLPALVQTVVESILEVFIVCLAGYVLGRRAVLDSNTRKQLNRVNVSLFTPCLLFSKVAFFLSPEKLKELWIVPLIFVLVTVTSMIIAWALGHVCRLRRSQRYFAIAAAMFMNTNSLPIALMQSLVVTVPGLKWGDDDNKNSMVGRALTYLVLHSTLGMILRWSYGVHLLSQADEETAAVPPTPTIEPPDNGFREPAAGASFATDETLHPDPLRVTDLTRLQPPHGHRDTSAIGRNPAFFYSFPYVAAQSPTGSGSQTPGSVDSEDFEPPKLNSDAVLPEQDGDEDETLPVHRPVTEPTTSRLHSIARRTKNGFVRLSKGFIGFMTAPLWAALASLVVACVQPLQHALDAHLQPVKGSIALAGACSIPVTLVVLGAYFVRSAPSSAPRLQLGGKNDWRKRVSQWWNTKEERPHGETRTVVVAIVSRMILAPAVLLPVTWMFAKFELHEMFDDPVFVVSTVLVISSPPAITLAQMTQQVSGDAFERLVSRTIFWAYLVATPPLTVLYVVMGLYVFRV